MEKLRSIEDSLKELHSEFNQQVASLNTDTKEFHNSLIDLSTKYPEHKELIQFIVFVNDKLETNQHMFGDVVVEAFNDLVNAKRSLVREIIESKTKAANQSCGSKLLGKIKSVGDIKVILISLAVIILSVGILMDPAFATKVVKILTGIFKG